MKTRWSKFWKRFIHRDVVDIFSAGILVPETVCIVASGPNGNAHYHRIPSDAYVVATNQAVLIPGIHPDMWVLNSVNRNVNRWIKVADKRFDGIRVFKLKHIQKLPRTLLIKPFYSYTSKGSLRSSAFRKKTGILYAGGTVSGFAIQIAAYLGAKKILLCGIDMSGQGYWDGTSTGHPKHGETWDNTANLNLLIEYLCGECGLSIQSLSTTKLDVSEV